MSRNQPPKRIPVLDYEADPMPWEAANDSSRIAELTRANIRLARRVEFWQWTALAAIVIAAVSQSGFLFLSIWYGS